jgi:glucose-6-phosphate isomerase
MRVDVGNALAETAAPGVSRAALERLDDRVARAHGTIEEAVAAGEFGYAALSLPDRTDAAAIERVADRFDPEAVVTVGIGGSALGAATVSAALGPSPDGVTHHVLDNVDPAPTRRLLDDLPLPETVLHAVSRSGTTTETLANLLVVREAMDGAGVDWTDRTVVTTGPDGPLWALADRHDLPAFEVPPQVPGRFAALSPVGLVAPALCGHDVGAVLDGAAGERSSLAPSLFDCPAYAYGAVCHALEARGAVGNVLMPYAEALERFAEWAAQLFAESLGKDGLGQTPVRALGATDQHSQLQLYRAGRRDKLLTFVRPRDRPELAVPEPGADDPAAGALAGAGGRLLGAVLDAEFEATEASLSAVERPSVRVEVEALDAAGVGRLLYGFEAACVLMGELAGVETFTQPAVEWAKAATRGLLDEPTEASRAVGEKTRLVVE